jgi:uncharacterized protein (UPF0305 family)
MIKMYNKYIISFQDLNSLQKLETKINGIALTSLKNLRTNRNEDCHYFHHSYQHNIIQSRFHVMNQRLDNIDPGIKKKLDAKYPCLIDEIKNSLLRCIVSNDPDPDPESLDDANEWWDE